MSQQHPLDKVFNIDPDEVIDIESQYAMAELPPGVEPGKELGPAAADQPTPDPKDADDVLVEQRLDTVYEAALTAYHSQSAHIEIIDPRYAARNAEVAANFLNLALQAANSRAKVKVDRKRANQTFIPHGNGGGGRNTTNIVVANREDILKMVSVDGEKKQV